MKLYRTTENCPKLAQFFGRERISQGNKEHVSNIYELSAYLFSSVLYNTLENGERDDLLPKIMKGLGDIILQVLCDQSIFKD